ncbi:tyrosine-type recombinase/integrase [Trinickia sp. EG282A]|uniref:tyrosine-type recombinase/integrase n=1 Tax=Trinickia sp. EG282A TaxID=3237013 RepID=UPI0034D2227E
MSTNTDLFAAGPAEWEAHPDAAFDTWLTAQAGRGQSVRMRASSAEMYRAQWRKFLAYVQSHHLVLTRVQDHHVSDFLASLDSENRSQRERYRKLIERVFADMHGGKPPRGFCNPAVAAMNERGAAWKAVSGNRPMTFLHQAERAKLIACLRSPVTGDEPTECWRQLRDRAMVASFLGAGLKVAEALRLTVNCIALENVHWINIKRPDSQFSHRTSPAPYAIDLLRRWLTERERSGCLGELVFPADLEGRPMHSVTALRATAALVLESGISDDRFERASPQTLRNTFAAEMFEAGESTKSVADSFGFAVILTAERMKASWQRWRSEHGASRRVDCAPNGR